MILRKSIILFFCLAFGVPAFYSQDKSRQIKADLKDAQFYIDNEDLLKAWELYRKVLKTDPLNETAGLNSAYCLNRLSYAQDSLFVLVPNLTASKSPDAKYYLAKIKHAQKQFDEALALLGDYAKADAKKRSIANEEVTYLSGVCANAKTLIGKPHLAVIRNMGQNINSEYDDYVPVIMPDESALYFTSKRKGSTGNKKNGDNSYFEDVYISHQVDGAWKKAENVGFPINSANNDACVALSADGHRMIVYRTSEDGLTGDLYTTQLGTHGHWEPLKLIGSEINSEFIETSACFSKDTAEIYFSSNRPGGYGGKDLYRIKKLPNGHWAAPFNLGPNVNTPYDDDAPFLHPDGVTLYFSSKGHNTIGGYDVFKCTLDAENNQFSPAENLGYPINDVGNDIFFVLSVDGQRGYYSSGGKRETFGGLDIYQIDTRFGDNDLVVKQAYTFLDGKAGQAAISLINSESNEVEGNFFSNAATGKFIMVLNPMKSYKLLVEQDGFETMETVINPVVLEKNDKPFKYFLKKSNAH